MSAIVSALQKSGSMNTNSHTDIMKQQIIDGLISWRQVNDICLKINALTVSANDDISKLSYVKGFILLSLIRHLFFVDASLKECFSQLLTENITLNELVCQCIFCVVLFRCVNALVLCFRFCLCGVMHGLKSWLKSKFSLILQH